MSNKLWQRCQAASEICMCTMLCLVAPHCWMLQKMSFRTKPFSLADHLCDIGPAVMVSV